MMLHIIRNFSLFVFIISSSNLLGQSIDYQGFPEWSWHKQDSTEYYLYTPSALKAGEKYSVALFLHGCCGTSYKATLRNTVDPPVRMWHNFGANTQRIPTYIIAPATSRGWKQHIPNLKKVIDDLIQNHQADPQRIYITGFSMGGNGTWQFINQYPDFFAAALPMGMDFSGEPEKIRHVPIWTNKGETDWYARKLNGKVAEIRKLNGNNSDSSGNWITGVNPMFTEFKGIGHGVQWIATSKQDLTGWAHSKINDGNKYPVVFFKSPAYKALFKDKSTVEVDIEAFDPDGSIKKIDVLMNGKKIQTIASPPYKLSLMVSKGDSKIEAIAFDDKGKSATATTIVTVDTDATILTKELPSGIQGGLYQFRIFSSGNGLKNLTVTNGSLPEGITLSPDGSLKGIPVKAGVYTLLIKVTDEDGDFTESKLSLNIAKKNIDEVIVTQVKNYAGKTFPTTKVAVGEQIHNDKTDDEVTLSNVGKFEGLTMIQTNVNDTINATPYYLEFTADEDVTVFIAYERITNPVASTIPSWLKEFKKESGMVAQYFYYDVYAKDFPKGKVTLKDAGERENKVNTNYFVMIKKKAASK